METAILFIRNESNIVSTFPILWVDKTLLAINKTI